MWIGEVGGKGKLYQIYNISMTIWDAGEKINIKLFWENLRFYIGAEDGKQKILQQYVYVDRYN